ncbi:MAG TPA: cobalamin biosynthesis protein CobW, partial [Anaerovibrio sp.]|nr:cobalamin biosynthesis protein CobW [Anaerovibrio sp.]
ELLNVDEVAKEHHHDHEHEHHNDEHHHHDEHEHHEHEHHHHDHECDDPNCGCHDHDHEHHHHDHDHHHHHHADDVFGSWGQETTKKFTIDELKDILAELVNADEYGVILRAKGIVMSANDGEWLHFNYVPGESSVVTGAADYTGRFCV